MTTLAAQDLTYRVDGRTLVDQAGFTLGGGQLSVLLGPNGAGKTTLLRLTLGLLRAASGVSRIEGVDVRRLSSTRRARSVTYLPQVRPLAWPARVRDVVALGRFAYGGPLGRLGSADAAAVERALDSCDLGALADRRADTLSGGELARVHLARALAAEAPLILADEPVAALDPLHQHQVMTLLRAAADAGAGVLVVLHDLALAARYADRLLWMRGGRILADGSLADTLTAGRIREIYDVRASVWRGGDGPNVLIEGIA